MKITMSFTGPESTTTTTAISGPATTATAVSGSAIPGPKIWIPR